jgi:ligand-binding sensor domain-containing protein
LYAATGEIVDVAVRGQEAWIAAIGGVIRIDLSTIRNPKPAQSKISDAEGLVSTTLTCLTIDAFGNVWVGTREDGVSVFDSQGRHIGNLFSFDDLLYSDKVIAAAALGQTETCIIEGRSMTCDRVVISGADSYAPSTGLPEGGGFVIVRIGRDGDRWVFEREGFANTLAKSQELLTESGGVWIGTAGQGLWRRDDGTGMLDQVLSRTDGGLVSDNVKKLVRAPALGQPGPDVLWIGTGGGLHAWNGAVLDTIAQFSGQNILDLYGTGDRLYVLAETPSPDFDRDLYEIDLTQPSTLRIPRSDCAGDTLYAPREVGVSDDGKIVLGTRVRSFSVRDGLDWICPPPLGPHWPRVADLDIDQDGILYFGTGDQTGAARSAGVGLFDGTDWSALTPPDVLHENVTEVEVWPDGSIWFGSRVSAQFGGLNRYLPPDSMEAYFPTASGGKATLGRNIWSMGLDAGDNLWVCYGQAVDPGLSVIEWPSRQITDFPFEIIFANATTALRDLAFDSQNRVWVTTFSEGPIIGKVYVIDTNGTIADQSDDEYTEFNVANEIEDIGEVLAVSIDSSDQIWLAGGKGLVVGQIDNTNVRFTDWDLVEPTSSQLGGRNPLPYRVSKLDWDESIWIGTESSGLVRVSRDQVTWTWFDQLAGCPLPDQSITGLHVDERSKSVYVGTANGGIARIGLTGGAGPTESTLEAYPNPWALEYAGDDPKLLNQRASIVTFEGIPPDETTEIRIYSAAGELVHEKVIPGPDPKTWNGTNARDALVESGVYLVVAKSSDGTRGKYEGKVAVIR